MRQGIDSSRRTGSEGMVSRASRYLRIREAAFLLYASGLGLLSSGSSWLDTSPIVAEVVKLRSIYDTIDSASVETMVPRGMIEAVLMVESGMNPDAKSKKRKDGAQDLGIAQHNSSHVATFAKLFNGGVAYDPMNPQEAIIITARILADHYYTANHGAHPRSASWRYPIAFYNQGIGSVFRHGIMPQTFRHIAKVSNVYGKKL